MVFLDTATLGRHEENENEVEWIDPRGYVYLFCLNNQIWYGHGLMGCHGQS